MEYIALWTVIVFVWCGIEYLLKRWRDGRARNKQR